jgi:AcrR family transcriptional regulator
VSHAALRHYFSSRDELLVEVYRTHEAGAVEDASSADESAVGVMAEAAERNRSIPGLVELYATLSTDALQERHVVTREFVRDRFIPQWRGLKVRERAEDGSERLVDPERPMTVRDLLMHMSGLGFAGRPTLQELFSAGSLSQGRGFVPGLRRGPDATLATMVEHYAGYPLMFHPGRHWLYSVSTDICARLVEIISGQRFDDYLRETIFEPLGMTDTAFMVPDHKAGRFAACYRRNASKKLTLVDDPQRSEYRQQPSFLSGGGGLVCTATDYLRFCQMLLFPAPPVFWTREQTGAEACPWLLFEHKHAYLRATHDRFGEGSLLHLLIASGLDDAGIREAFIAADDMPELDLCERSSGA